MQCKRSVRFHPSDLQAQLISLRDARARPWPWFSTSNKKSGRTSRAALKLFKPIRIIGARGAFNKQRLAAGCQPIADRLRHLAMGFRARNCHLWNIPALRIERLVLFPIVETGALE